MPSDLETMARSARLGNSSESSAVDLGGATASFLPSGGRAPLPLLHLIPTAHLKINDQNRPIPLRGNFVNETPKFFRFKPAVLSSNEFPDF
jgi:hypothetical protein